MSYGKGRGGRPWRRKVEAVKRRDQYTCQACGRSTELGCCDHKVPVSQGGTDELSNLQWLCIQCHDDKSYNESRAGQGLEPKLSRAERRCQPGDHWAR
jgi:5-methylcytosine-specific restriction protein A